MDSHAHSHAAPQDFGRRFAVGIAINCAFIVVQVVYGIMADSLSLLADAGHNASDVLALALAWGATLLARRAPSGRFTYGLQGSSILAAFINAALLLGATAIICWEAFERLASPVVPQAATVMVVAGIGVVVNGATAWLFLSGRKHDLNIEGAFLHMAADAGISLGVVAAGGLILLTGWAWIDPAVSILISLIIVAGTWRLLKDSVALALQAAPRGVDTEAVRHFLASRPGVREVHDLHIWALSTTTIALSAHLWMPAGHPGNAFIREASEELDSRFHIGHTTLQIEIGERDDCALDCDHAHTA